LRGTGSTRHPLGMSANHAIVVASSYLAVATYNEHGFLLKRHGLEHLIDIVRLKFHLCRNSADTPKE